MKLFIYLLITTLPLMISCKQKSENRVPTAFDEAPEWSHHAIWYQIFVERFRNGNTANDPTQETIKNSLIDPYPETWTVTPWGHNWYQQEEWAKKTGLDFYRTIQMRRYGGDLEGVMQKLPYLKDLGINALYFNPINDSPTLHKYDARYYHHVDVTFGGDIDKNKAIISQENPADPSTWQWTPADKLFVELIRECHNQGMKVVLDFSFNHTGREFWAFKDLIEKQGASQYKDWYDVKSFEDAATGTTFDYEGWYGIKQLPIFKKITTGPKEEGEPVEGDMPQAVKEHIYAVCKRWMDPNDDGNPEDGIDGMRLDVADHVPIGFWRAFRKEVRKINPDFYLVGENWWKKWPDELMDAKPWVKGDAFDAVMHYQWYKPARAVFNKGDDGISVAEFHDQISNLFGGYSPNNAAAMMNLTSSHDSPRFWTSIQNRNKYKFMCKPSENAHYNTQPPNEATLKMGKALLVHQFTMIGAPHIWNGDEMGMAGADDPDNRKPLLWPDLDFEPETPLTIAANPYLVKPMLSGELTSFYKQIIDLRNKHIILRKGDYQPIPLPDYPQLLVYSRNIGENSIKVVINTSPEPVTLGIKDHLTTHFDLNIELTGEVLTLDGYGALVYATKNLHQ